MTLKVRTHLMFDGTAEEAMSFYVSLFPNSLIAETEKYDSGDHKGKIKMACFSLAGREFICIDTPVKHEFGFTPAISIFVDFDKLPDLQQAFAALSNDGEVFMPLDNYGFSTKFGWVQDRFGVSWQLNLP